MATGAHLEGMEAVLQKMGRIKQKTLEGMKKAVHECAERVLERSQFYVPVDTGALKDSGHVEDVVQAWGGPTSSVVYGPHPGASQPVHYAIFVHENMDAYHAPPTGAKFLERAVRELQPELEQIAGAEVRAAIRSI